MYYTYIYILFFLFYFIFFFMLYFLFSLDFFFLCLWFSTVYYVPKVSLGFPGGSGVMNLPANAGDTGDMGLIPG